MNCVHTQLDYHGSSTLVRDRESKNLDLHNGKSSPENDTLMMLTKMSRLTSDFRPFLLSSKHCVAYISGSLRDWVLKTNIVSLSMLCVGFLFADLVHSFPDQAFNIPRMNTKCN